jgi:hypothetical protein
MANDHPDKKPKHRADDREERLKAALKANMARRKAQAQDASDDRVKGKD